MSERGRQQLFRARHRVLIVAAGLVLLALPLYLQAFWLQLGVIAMAAMVGAIGLNLLVGTTGQLSLAHGFFLAVGAYGYAFLAGDSSNGGSGGAVTVTGLNLPAPLAALLAVAGAGLAGLLFAPVAGRLRGIYLGLASLSLVFIGQHLLFNASSVTGGFNGRAVPEFELFGFSFSDDEPALVVLGVPFGAPERLWYLAIGLVVAASVLVRNITRSRPGRALQMVRDNEVAASCLGVPVNGYKAAAFTLSSMLAGAAGILLALAFRHIVPEYFGLLLSVDYLAMIVIGGMGSVLGAALGATLVTALPLVLARYSDHLPFLATAGGGIDPNVAARILFGLAVVTVLLLEPGGIVALARRLSRATASLLGLPRTPRTEASVAETPATTTPERSTPHA